MDMYKEYEKRLSKTERRRRYKDKINRLIKVCVDSQERGCVTGNLDSIRGGVVSDEIRPKDFKNALRYNKVLTKKVKNYIMHKLWGRQKPSVYVLLLKRAKMAGDNKYLEKAEAFWNHGYVYEVLAIIGSDKKSQDMFWESIDIHDYESNSSHDVTLDVGYPISEYWYKNLFEPICRKPGIYDHVDSGVRVYAEVVDAYRLINSYPDIAVVPQLQHLVN